MGTTNLFVANLKKKQTESTIQNQKFHLITLRKKTHKITLFIIYCKLKHSISSNVSIL